MKTRKMSLANIQDQLSKTELKNIMAGSNGICCCGCLYANQGGSSTDANQDANYAKGLSSPGCPFG